MSRTRTGLLATGSALTAFFIPTSASGASYFEVAQSAPLRVEAARSFSIHPPGVGYEFRRLKWSGWDTPLAKAKGRIAFAPNMAPVVKGSVEVRVDRPVVESCNPEDPNAVTVQRYTRLRYRLPRSRSKVYRRFAEISLVASDGRAPIEFCPEPAAEEAAVDRERRLLAGG